MKEFVINVFSFYADGQGPSGSKPTVSTSLFHEGDLTVSYSDLDKIFNSDEDEFTVSLCALKSDAKKYIYIFASAIFESNILNVGYCCLCSAWIKTSWC